MENKKRLCDADALADKLQQHHDFFVNAWRGFRNLPAQDKARVDEITHCIAEITNAPTIDAAEVVHGRWMIERSPVEAEIKCSECGYSYIDADSYVKAEYNYCPNCGAKMDGDGNA